LFYYLTSYSSYLRLLPCLLATSTSSLIMCFTRHFLLKTWPIQLAFLRFIVCTLFLSSRTLFDTATFSTRSSQMIFSILHQQHIESSQGISELRFELSNCIRTVQLCSNFPIVLELSNCIRIFQLYSNCAIVFELPNCVRIFQLYSNCPIVFEFSNVIKIFQFYSNCPIVFELSNCVRIVQLCSNCPIVLEMSNYIRIFKFYSNSLIVFEMSNCIRIVQLY